jgi:hypothetical protein
MTFVAKGKGPGVDLLLVAIDQRAIDVEEDSFDRHRSCL